MKKTLSRIAIIILLISPGFSLQLQGIAGAHPAPNSTAGIIDDTYRTLSQHINQNQNILNNFAQNLLNFTTTLELPPVGNAGTLINRLTAMFNRLQTVTQVLPRNNPFWSSFNNANQLVFGRLKRARLDNELINGNLVDEGFNLPGIPPQVQNALHDLTGAIYHIVKTEHYNNGVLQIVESVRRVGSGIALPTLQQVNNQIVPNGHNPINLTNVLTCSHVIEALKNEKIEVYFVPNRHLHNSGWPHPNVLLGNGNHGNNMNYDTSMINFLRNNNTAFHLNNFEISRNINPVQAQNFQEHTQPQYHSSEDVVIAHINLKHGQVHANLPNNISITLKSGKNQINQHLQNIRQQNRDYFAIGRPGMRHYTINMYMLNNEPLAYQNWVAVRGYNPLITSSQAGQPHYPSIVQSQISHNALTAKGMSGGPLITIDINNHQQPLIEVFGVVNSGNINNNFAGFWK